MCGICGFARNPDSDTLEQSKAIFNDLVLSIEPRGRHATGMAAVGPDGADNPFIMKWASPASVVIPSAPWQKGVDGLGKGTSIVLGHTRYASHNNKDLDEAAHPFRQGRVVGGHNGIIHNWREIQNEVKPEKSWIVDSQAAFSLLDKAKNPLKALECLDGYFSLEWIKGHNLFLTRSPDGVLACAYVPSHKALYWNSQQDNLTRVLKAHGLSDTDYEIWLPKPETVYRYNPAEFSEDGTNKDRVLGTYRSKGGKTRWNTSKTDGDSRKTRVFADGSIWNGTTATQTSIEKTLAPVRKGSGELLLSDMNKRILKLEADNNKLWSILEAAGLLDDDSDLTGYTEDTPPADEQIPLMEIPVCKVCDGGYDARRRGRLLLIVGGEYIHENCLESQLV